MMRRLSAAALVVIAIYVTVLALLTAALYSGGPARFSGPADAGLTALAWAILVQAWPLAAAVTVAAGFGLYRSRRR